MRPAESLRSLSGFGIVSVLVAVVLLAVGIVALSSSSAFIVSMQTDAAERSRASAIAVTYMEQVKTRLPTEISSESPVRVDETGEPDENGAFIRSLVVTPEADTPDVVRATVRTRTLELVTFIFTGGN